jgi:hypothetical protein
MLAQQVSAADGDFLTQTVQPDMVPLRATNSLASVYISEFGEDF